MVALERLGPDAGAGLTLDRLFALPHDSRFEGTTFVSVLVVDIGNTSTSLALYNKGRVGRVVRMDSGETTAARIRQRVRGLGGRRIIRGAMIASVVPRLDAVWNRTLSALVEGPVSFVHHRLKLGVEVRYPRPATIGADRLANASGGIARYGRPLIVADFGTAVTFDIITKTAYEGGIIAPGLPLVFDYLAEKTAKLPRLRDVNARGPWGRSTEQAMRLGARWGYPGLVRGILGELRKHPALRRARVVVTGGHARLVASALGHSAVVDPDLTLYGVGLIFELNHGSTT